MQSYLNFSLVQDSLVSISMAQAVASAFPSVSNAKNWIENLKRCMWNKPVFHQEDEIIHTICYENGNPILNAGQTIECIVNEKPQSIERYVQVSRGIVVGINVGDYRGDIAQELLPMAQECLEKTFVDMCKCIKTVLADGEDDRVINMLENEDFSKGSEKMYTRLVMFGTHFVLAVAKTFRFGKKGNMRAVLEVIRFGNTKNGLRGIQLLLPKDCASYQIVKLSQHEQTRMEDRKTAAVMSMHRRLGGKSHLGVLDPHLLQSIVEQAEKMDRAYVERMLIESMNPIVENTTASIEDRIHAAFNDWTQEYKQMLIFYAHNSASLDYDSFRNLERKLMIDKVRYWAINDLIRVKVSVYSGSSVNGNFRGMGPVCEYMVPLELNDLQVQMVNRVLQADHDLQLQFVRQELLKRNDPSILKMYSNKCAGQTIHIALFKDYGVVASVYAAGQSGWNSIWHDCYRLCTSMNVVTFPYDEESLKKLKVRYIGEDGDGWEAVNLGQDRNGADAVPDIMPAPWHAAQQQQQQEDAAAAARHAAQQQQQREDAAAVARTPPTFPGSSKKRCVVSSSFCARCGKLSLDA